MMDKLPKVFFLKATCNKTKIFRLIQVLHEHFLMGEKVIVILPTKKAVEYLDRTLWELPKESFLPHRSASGSAEDRIVLTHLQENLNQANILLNLSTQASPIYTHFEKIYELLDETDPEKNKLSLQKMAQYKEWNLIVEERNLYTETA